MKKDSGEELAFPPEVVLKNFYVDASTVSGRYMADSYVLKTEAHNKHHSGQGKDPAYGFYDPEYKRKVLSRRATILKVVGDDKDTVVRVSYLTLMLGLSFSEVARGRRRLSYNGPSRSAVIEYLGSVRGEFSVIPCQDIRGYRVPFGFPRMRPVPWFMRIHATLLIRNDPLRECVLCRGGMPLFHGFRNTTGRVYDGCPVHDLCAVYHALQRVPEGYNRFPTVFKCSCGKEHNFHSDSPLFEKFLKSRVAGDDVGGMHTSLKKLTRNAIVHNGPASLVYKAIALTLRACDVSYSSFSLPVPDLFDPMNYMHKYPQTKGGALLMRHVKSREEEGVYIGNFMNPYRSEAANTAAFVSVGVAHFALNELDKSISDAIRSLNENIMCTLKTAFKQEVKETPHPRVFQVASIFDLSIEKVIFSPLQKMFSGRFPFMVGFRWTHQGANQIAEYMSYQRSDKYRWADYDISGLDVDLIASVVIAILNTLFGFFHIDFPVFQREVDRHFQGMSDQNSKKLIVFYLLYSKMIQNYSGKIITFPDFFRIIVGGMSSGQLNTSFLDTLYCIVMVFAWLLVCAQKVPAAARSEWVMQNIQKIHFLIYGDDGLIRLRKDSGLHILTKCNTGPLPSYQQFLKEYFNLSIKEEESGEYDVFLTEVSPEGEILYPGPKILQRYFVWHDKRNIVAPLRVTSRAAPRLLSDQTEFKGIDAFKFQLLRILGHMYDCSGTNYYYYNMLVQMHNSIVNVLDGDVSLPEEEKAKQKFTLAWESKIFQIVGRDKEIAAAMIESTGLLHYPSFQEIDELFNGKDVPQEFYVDSDAIMDKIGEYSVMF